MKVSPLSVFILVILMFGVFCENAQEDVYQDGYYEDSYEEETIAVQVNNDAEIFHAETIPEKFVGYHRNNAAKIVKILRPLASDNYINDTTMIYDCVKKVDAHILFVEPEEEEEEDEEVDIQKQVTELRKRIEAVTSMAIGKAMGQNMSAVEETIEPIDPNFNATAANITATAAAKKEKEKKMTFRDKQQLKKQARIEKEILRDKTRPQFRIGADCESLVCGSCTSIVEEFGRALYTHIENDQYKYVEQVLTGFCESKSIALQYIDIVRDICDMFEKQPLLGYKESLISAYETHPPGKTWRNVGEWSNLNAKKQQVCLEVGACNATDFRFQTVSEHRVQEQWDDKCFTCQAFASNMETKIHLTRHLTEGNVMKVVQETCSRMTLPSSHQSICSTLISDQYREDIAWLTKMHGEAIDRKVKGEKRFPDLLCEKIKFCKPWVDPRKLRESQARATMQAVFY